MVTCLSDQFDYSNQIVFNAATSITLIHIIMLEGTFIKTLSNTYLAQLYDCVPSRSLFAM